MGKGRRNSLLSHIFLYMAKGKQLIGIFLLILYIFFYVGANLQPHTHIVDGVTIVHSHFSKDTLPFANHKTTHTHKTSEINLIHDFNISLFFIVFIAISLRIIVQKPIKIVVEREILIPLKSYLYNPCLRAPPIS